MSPIRILLHDATIYGIAFGASRGGDFSLYGKGAATIGARYDMHVMLIEAALAGLGVALAPHLGVEADQSDGRLIAPWPEGTSVSKTHCLVLAEQIHLSDVPVRAFAE